MSYRPERGGGGGHSGSSGFGGRGDHRGGRGGGQGGRGDHPPPGSGGGGLPPARGDQINVQLNLFEVRQLPTKPFAQYDIDIKPFEGPLDSDKQLSTRRKQDIIDKLVNTNSAVFPVNLAFDGQKIAWSGQPVDLGRPFSATFIVDMSTSPVSQASNKGKFNVTVQYTASIEPSYLNDFLARPGKQTPDALKAIMLLQQLVLSVQKTLHATQSGRSFFPNTRGDRIDIGGGFQAFKGFYQSVRPSIGRMLVNVDTTTRAGYKPGPIVAIIVEMINSNRGPRINERDLERLPQTDPVRWRKLSLHFKNVRVTVHYTGSTQTTQARPIKELVPWAGFYRFEDHTGEEMTVKEYYSKSKNVTIRSPEMFGVRVGKANIIPAELVQIAQGQLFTRKVPSELTSQMLKAAEMDPHTRLAAIRQGIKESLRWRDSAVLQSAGMTISPEPMQTTARVLPMPRLQYGPKNAPRYQQAISGGMWNVTGQVFLEPAVITQWAVIDYTEQPDILLRFAKELRDTLRSRGLTVPEAPPQYLPGNGHSGRPGLVHNLERLNPGTSLVVAVLRPSTADVKRIMKNLTLTHTNCLATQCVNIERLQASSRTPNALSQYANNLALKINVKLGGINAKVEHAALSHLTKHNTMILGADVTHPGPGVFGKPSIASLVWTIDPHFTRYNVTSKVQSPRTEIIADLYDMVYAALRDYASHRHNNGRLPENLLMYRDGVSEGEFERVRKEECAAIQAAVDALWSIKDSKYQYAKPALCFIVVGKRHHVRIFPEKTQPKHTRPPGGGNCAPGVLVDTQIQSPYVEDWYLLSQGGIKGTSIPAHYMLLENNNPAVMPVDMLKQASFALCFSYHRATRSVSIPAPVYYADLVCTYAQYQLADNFDIGENASTVGSSEDGPIDLIAWKQNFKDVNKVLRQRFYFL